LPVASLEPVNKHRPFRFGVQEHRANSTKQWRERVQTLESMGFATLYLPDHFSDQAGPIAALVAAADATTGLRVGSLVFDNDYRHPVVLAKEAATIDLLSDGRFELGIGAGWLASDYEQSGIQYDAAGTRIERLEEAVQIIKRFFGGREFSFRGKHYAIKGLEGAPLPVQKPHPPLLLGGGGRRMLRLAAREADIVHVNYNLNEGRINPRLVRTGMAEATDEKLGWVREAAGERFGSLELSTILFFGLVVERRGASEEAARLYGLSDEEGRGSPHLLVGPKGDVVERAHRFRERFGISFLVVSELDATRFAPAIEELRHR